MPVVTARDLNLISGCIWWLQNSRHTYVTFGAKGWTLETKVTISLKNTDILVTPGGKGSHLQALFVVKHHLKQLCHDWLWGGDNALTPDGRIKKASMTLLCRWTWQCIALEVTVKGLKILCTHYNEQTGLIICCGMTMKRMKMVGVSVRKTRIWRWTP
jgi:hypothetical protein